MKIEITTDRRPFLNGVQCELGEKLTVTAEDGAALISNGFAKELKAAKKKTTKKSAPKRARNAKGQLKADDPTTPDVNEAWEGGKAPK